MRITRYILLVVFVAGMLSNAMSQRVRFNERLEGAALAVGSQMEVVDDHYYDMLLDASWPTRFAYRTVNNYVRLSLNPEIVQTGTFSGTVQVRVKYDELQGGIFVSQTQTRNLTVNYNTNGLAEIDEQTTYTFANAHRIQVEVLNISGGLTLEAVYLEAGLDLDRVYSYDGSTVEGISHRIFNSVGVVTTNPVLASEMEIFWDSKTGAERYELEWVHVNSYTLEQGVEKPTTDLSYNFYLNSTRIELTENFYRFPLIMDRGYIVYRVRAIGRKGADLKRRQEGLWSAVESGKISDIAAANRYHVAREYDPAMNWSHQVAYNEEGKRFEGVSFMDGLGRMRQSVAKNSQTNQVVVSNVYYDELGRVAVSDLPTPVDEHSMHHFPFFNLSASDGTAYNNTHFGGTVSSTDCSPTSIGFSQTSGAGRYYSPANPNQDGANGLIPDAEQYPFNRIVYRNDFTDRVDRVGAAGEDLNVGSGKETRMYYLTPEQEELNALFGVEVGDKSHYQKLATRDANGQTYVQIMDMAGRVIASYMEGMAPTTLDALPESVAQNERHEILVSGQPQNANTIEGYSERTYTQLVTDANNFTFSYNFMPESYSQQNDACLDFDVCLDCVYDLTIEIFDECGNFVNDPASGSNPPNVKTVNGTNLNDVCSIPEPQDYNLEIYLQPGEYVIKKRLEVNKESIEQYWCMYLEHANCVDPVTTEFNSLYTEALAEEQFSDCTPETLVDTDEQAYGDCAIARAMMLSDMSPGGQYGLVEATTTGYEANDLLSVYNNTGNSLSGNWTLKTFIYTDNSGQQHTVSSLTEMISNFQDAWAEQLLEYHPEKCQLDYCLSLRTYRNWDNAFEATSGFNQAEALGYLKSVAGLIPDITNPVITTAVADPFFSPTPAPGSTQASWMQDRITNYEQLGTGINTRTYSLYEWALFQAMVQRIPATPAEMDALLDWAANPTDASNAPLGASCTAAFEDAFWVFYRESYQELKAEAYERVRATNLAAISCSNAQIGVPEPVSSAELLYAQRAPRFINEGVLPVDPTDPTEVLTEVDATVEAACQNSCAAYADDWYAQLSNCEYLRVANLPAGTETNIKQAFIALCKSGCNSTHPAGSTTTPPGVTVGSGFENINDILDFYLDDFEENSSCTELLITEPGPYRTMDAIAGAYEQTGNCCPNTTQISLAVPGADPLTLKLNCDCYEQQPIVEATIFTEYFDVTPSGNVIFTSNTYQQLSDYLINGGMLSTTVTTNYVPSLDDGGVFLKGYGPVPFPAGDLPLLQHAKMQTVAIDVTGTGMTRDIELKYDATYKQSKGVIHHVFYNIDNGALIELDYNDPSLLVNEPFNMNPNNQGNLSHSIIIENIPVGSQIRFIFDPQLNPAFDGDGSELTYWTIDNLIVNVLEPGTGGTSGGCTACLLDCPTPEEPPVGCQNCQAVETALTALHDRFSDEADFEQSPNYELIRTTYLNGMFGFSYGDAVYEDFISTCRATVEEPYCKINPQLEELVDVLNIQAGRGQLLRNTAINLLASNVAYKYGTLYESGLGAFYSTSTTTNTLTINFGNGTSNCSFSLDKGPVLAGEDYSFTEIVRFGQIQPLTNSCGANRDFRIEAFYYRCGKEVSAWLTGSNTCLDIQSCVCGDQGQTLCASGFGETQEDLCYQPRLRQLQQLAVEQYQAGLAEQKRLFTQQYLSHCSESFNSENFLIEGPFNRYQYTLFYYDQAGNLVHTVAPEGVVELNVNQAAQALDQVKSVSSSTVYPTPVQGTHLPNQEYVTTYKYNSYNQLVETTNPDQEGATQFWYDRYGRIIASQNPVQAAANLYSYSLYDDYGRPVEVGQVQATVSEFGSTSPDPFSATSILNDDKGAYFRNYIAMHKRTEVTQTIYDIPMAGVVATKFKSGGQQNLRLRVGSVLYYETLDLTTPGPDKYHSALHYSYDIHGNVIEQIQDVPQLQQIQQAYKSTQYNFELVSGNVKEVQYQQNERDQMTHHYEYDRLNRLTEVYTSSDGVHQSREAHYRYYDYGPLARVEIGQHQVQGMDYAYTINGWLKGMNSSTLAENKDMGRDGIDGYLAANPSVHGLFAKDVLAYTIGYFNSDYEPIKTAVKFEADYTGSNFDLAANNLYNGNIRNLVTSIQGMTTMGSVYKYDQLQRIKEARMYYNTNTDNSWTGITATDDYASSYAYDKNGNLTDLSRNGTFALGLDMDRFSYKYELKAPTCPSCQPTPWNRLDRVIDLGSNYGAYEDIKSGQSLANYDYDALGQLLSDEQEGIKLEWRFGDKKVKSIKPITEAGSDKPDILFEYNPFGQRILKIEKPRSGGTLSNQNDWKYTYYSYDANGQVMAVYELNRPSSNAGKATLKEQHLYGASRLGMRQQTLVIYDNGLQTPTDNGVKTQQLGEKRYEISNYLGNVNAVITDRKTANIGSTGALYEAVVVMTADYYPFGMTMPGRNTNGGDYRYGYNGIEKDNEVKGGGNSYNYKYRMHDARLGRFFAQDPLTSVYPHNSPYAFCENSPIANIEIEGLEKASIHEIQNAINYANTALGNDPLGTSFYIKGVTKEQFLNQITSSLAAMAIFEDYSNINGFWMCGPSSVAHMLLWFDPEQYVRMAIDLFNNGSTIVDGKVITYNHPSAFGNEIEYENGSFIGNTALNLTMQVALRANENQLFPKKMSLDKKSNVGTLPWEIAHMGRAMGLPVHHRNYYFWTNIRRIRKDIQNGKLVVILDNGLFYGTSKPKEFIYKNVGDHYMTVHDISIDRKNKTVTVSYWQHGRHLTETVSIQLFKTAIKSQITIGGKNKDFTKDINWEDDQWDHRDGSTGPSLPDDMT